MGFYQLILYIEKAIALLLCFYVFEITKAVASAVQGDPTPKQQKMLTLNIFKYFEPIGFLLGFFFGYGWGQPAPTAPRYYKNRKTGVFITFTAPIFVSLLLAVAFHGLGLLTGKVFENASNTVPVYVYLFLTSVSDTFVRLAIFNLIPIPPMCGSEIIKCFLTPNQAFRYGQNAPIFQMVFLMLWFFGLITPYLDIAVSVVEKVLFAMF